MKEVLLLVMIVVALAGCTTIPTNSAPPVASDSIAIVAKEVPGYGLCTFAMAGGGSGSYGGTAMVLIGCRQDGGAK